ncbi:replication initiation protein [Actinokineospora sp. PR83]|uniref:replication initiator n=1 Tax=Actinokineospora sp. PR83 TaxID=2884908 RepID=UPI001F38B500|nr:replication initiator [Actinokineospora sp. PR83]MCG8915389.1 replication initiation protein [Actinokineospora sp. PR83]
MATTTTRPEPLVEPATEDEQWAALLRGKGYKAWRANVQAVGGCAKPVRLSGEAAWVGSDGYPVREISGSILAACNNRRETVCPACSARYAADTFHLVRAGLTGGKGIPETVAGHVRAFVTLTAPSFGPVHNRPTTRTGKPRPCGCGEYHHEHDTRIGSPLDPQSYDYVGAVLWQAHAPELWRRFTITASRHLADALGVPRGKAGDYFRLSYTKVAEYQRRGLVHFHAVIRLDGPDGPTTPPPAGVTPDLLAAVVKQAAGMVSLTSPDSDTAPARVLRWGAQVDAEPIDPTTGGSDDQVVHDRKVAGYIAKYATKGTGTTIGVDSPIRHEHQIAGLDVTPHARAMIATAWRLGGLGEFAQLRLRKWAHMLGFRGHFLTKSRAYSVTFKTLRAARGEHRRTRELAELGITDTDSITVINDWAMTGIGYQTAPERELAAAIAELTAHKRRARMQEATP